MGQGGHQHPPHVPTPRYRTEVKHIKVMTAEGLYRLTEKKAFKGLVVGVGAPQTPTPLPGGPPLGLGGGLMVTPLVRVVCRSWWSSTSATPSKTASRRSTRPCWCPSRNPRAGLGPGRLVGPGGVGWGGGGGGGMDGVVGWMGWMG